MRITLEFAKRNLYLFFRDRAAVFFSLLALFIIIGLYALFLGEVVVEGVKDIAGEQARFLMDSWIMAGTLAVTATTTTLGAFGIMVSDKVRKIARDFQAAPVKRSQILGGYFISSWTVGMLMSLVAFLLAEIYIVGYGGYWIGLILTLKLIGVMILSVFSSTTMMLFLVSFFTSINAYAAASTVIGSLIGFLTGIYVPVGNLPKAVQTVIKVFPPSYAGSLYRQLMMQRPFNLLNLPTEISEEIKLIFGVNFLFGEKIISPGTSVLILVGSGILFFALAVYKLSRSKLNY